MIKFSSILLSSCNLSLWKLNNNDNRDYVSGEIKPSDDISEAKFFSKEEIKDIVELDETTDTIKQVLKDINWI